MASRGSVSSNRGKAAASSSSGAVPSGVDQSTFFSPTIPPEVKECVLLLNTAIPPENTATVVLQILRDVLTGSVAALPTASDRIDELQRALELASIEDKFSVIYTGLYEIIHTALRKKVKSSDFIKTLTAMNLQETTVAAISKVYVQFIAKARAAAQAEGLPKKISAQLIPSSSNRWLPTVTKMKWRIDVTISSGSLSRVMRPNLSVQLILSDGNIKTFDVSMEQFHQLRHAIAKLLYDMQTVERHPIMKIVKEFGNREDEDIVN